MAKRVVCFDIQFSAELIKALDDKISLYSKEQEEEEDKDQTAMEVEVSFFDLLSARFMYPFFFESISSHLEI